MHNKSIVLLEVLNPLSHELYCLWFINSEEIEITEVITKFINFFMLKFIACMRDFLCETNQKLMTYICDILYY